MEPTHAKLEDHDGAADVGHPRLALLWIAAAVALALHNVEEWLLDMSGWIADHPWLPGGSLHGDAAEFGLVLAIVTLAVLGLATVAIVARPRWSAEVLVCLAYVLMVNAVSHALLSLLSWSLMPGVISGVVLLLPLGVFITRTLPSVRWTPLNIALTIAAAVGVTVGAFALASVLTGLL